MFLNSRCNRKHEKFINANQLLLEFPEDKELQASLEAARKEAEEEVERITYTRKKQAKPKITKRDSFPDHLPREEIEVVIPGEFQQRIDPGELVLKRHQYTETLKHIPAKLVVLRHKQPVLAFTQNLEKEILVDAEANLGDKSLIAPSSRTHFSRMFCSAGVRNIQPQQAHFLRHSHSYISL